MLLSLWNFLRKTCCSYLNCLKLICDFWATGTLLQEIYFLNPQLLGTYALLPPPLKGGRQHQGVSLFYKLKVMYYVVNVMYCNIVM